MTQQIAVARLADEIALAVALSGALKSIGGARVVVSGEPNPSHDYYGILIDGDFNLIGVAMILKPFLYDKSANASK